MDVDGWKVMTYSTMYRTSHDPLVWWTNNILYIQQLKGYLLHFELDKCLKKKVQTVVVTVYNVHL